MLRRRITETTYFAEFSLKQVHAVFSSLETLSRRSQKKKLDYFLKRKALQGCSWFSPISTYCFISVCSFHTENTVQRDKPRKMYLI